jgi:hypothetical protein
MSVADPSVPVEKSRSRIDRSSRATTFGVVQGSDGSLDALRLPDFGDVRSSNSRAYAWATNVAASSGQSKKASRVEVDRGASDGAPARRFSSFVSCSEFIWSSRSSCMSQPPIDGVLPPVHTPNGYVSGSPLTSAVSSGVTAWVLSNQIYSSNCCGRLARK